jgi:hypothetical protein
VSEFDAAIERTLAAGTARLRLFRAKDPPETWRDAGHATADFRHRRTHVVFRPIPSDMPPLGLPPDTEVEYLFDGGRRWVKRPDSKQWGHRRGAIDGPRHVADPTWILDALLGAAAIGDQDAADGHRVSLDLTVAERALGHPIDLGRGRAALLWRPRLRRWRRAVPARVWLDQAGYLARAEYLDPPWSRLFQKSRTWNGVELSALGEPVDPPCPPSDAAA